MSYPKSDDKKIQKLSNLLVSYAEREGLVFSFAEDEIYPLETFAHFGGLSLFLIEAKEHYEKIYNKLYTVNELMEPFSKSQKELSVEQKLKEDEYLKSLPMEHEFPVIFESQEENTYFGFVPRLVNTIGANFSIVTHFTHYSLEEYVKIYKRNKMLLIDGKIPLDPLFEKMSKKVNSKQIRIVEGVKLKNTLDEEVRNS